MSDERIVSNKSKDVTEEEKPIWDKIYLERQKRMFPRPKEKESESERVVFLE